MKTSVKHDSNNLMRLVFWAASFALVASFVLFILEKSSVTNFYEKPAPTTQNPSTTRPVNDVNYSPATTTEQDEANRTKQALIDQANNTNQNQGNVTISLSAAGQDTAGGPLIVKALINGISSGTCNLKLIKDSVVKTYTASVADFGSYYGCDGFSIPYSDLSNGKWQLTLTSGSGTISQSVEIK